VCQELLWPKYGDSSDTEKGERPAVGSRYQRTGEETADREDSVSAVVKCRV
jgi:hypothetical protein